MPRPQSAWPRNDDSLIPTLHSRLSPFDPRSLILPLFLVLSILACDLSNPTPAVWALTPTALARAAAATAFAATQAGQAVILPTFTPVPTLVQPTITSASSVLTPSGPWLVYPTNGGQTLVALNPDGSGSSRVDIPPLLTAADLVSGMSPRGGMLAFRTGLSSDPSGAAIFLLYLPSMRLERITPLLSESEQALVQSGQNPRAADTAAGVVARSTLAWSPDGRYLAFIGALDRNAADMYLYDTVNQKITRMTFGSNMTATPTWSPNGHWIIAQEILSFTGSAGWQLGDVWQTESQTDVTAKLYTPPVESLGEVFVGWINDTTLVLYSLSPTGGESLRLINSAPYKITTIVAGAFDELAFDPASKVIAFTRKTPAIGLYIQSPDSVDPRLVQAGQWQDLQWFADGGKFIARSPQGVVSVSPDGAATLLAGESQLSPSPGGKWLAGWGDGTAGSNPGLRLYGPGGGLLQQVLTDPVQAFAWKPDATGFFFISGSHLDQANFPSLQVTPLDSDLRPGIKPILLWTASK